MDHNQLMKRPITSTHNRVLPITGHNTHNNEAKCMFLLVVGANS